MLLFLLRRLLGGLAALVAVAFVAFLLLGTVPGDAADALAGEYASAEQMAAVREEMGLNAPLLTRFGRFLADAVLRGDLGSSLISSRPVRVLVLDRFQYTLWLTLTAVLLAPLSTPATAYIGYGSSLPVLACTWPAWYARMPRLARDALRFALGACIVLLVSMLWQGPVLLGVANVAALAIIRHVMLRRRAAMKSRGCEGCPEQAEYGVCPGFADQAVHIRQFEQAATDKLTQLTAPPRIAPHAAPRRQL